MKLSLDNLDQFYDITGYRHNTYIANNGRGTAHDFIWYHNGTLYRQSFVDHYPEKALKYIIYILDYHNTKKRTFNLYYEAIKL